MKSNKAVKAVKAGKASVPARKLELVKPEEANKTGLALALAASGMKVEATEKVKQWTDAEVESNYQDFVTGLKSTYGHVMKFAQAHYAGGISDVQVRNLYATHAEEDTAGKWLAAFKEALRTVQADKEGNLPKDAYTFNVNKQTGILARATIVPRVSKGSLRKLAEKAARFIIKATEGMTEEKAEQYRKNAAAMFEAACSDPVTFTAK